MKWLLCLTLLAQASDKPTVRASSTVIQAGGSVRITCKVPRHALNRGVTWGFSFYTTRFRDLEGEDAPITYEQLFVKVPCDPGVVFCEVTRADGTSARAVSNLLVAGCDNADEN